MWNDLALALTHGRTALRRRMPALDSGLGVREGRVAESRCTRTE